ncbi:hypothetical protein [Devosia sp. SL43]|uniref:hypothetical protein n=1 Tax=Devosia sp. SL43 TaxID=2806348 RepID=UPI001F34A1A1|nr:hypothetical protein [Devosia sp. SL43]UJW85822.1 hypothetical protein IM737_00500 [Devosia sp. SL43]
MFHSPKSVLICSILAAAALSTPALAKDKAPVVIEGAALDRACINAFGGQEHFSWTPRMGIQNAVSTCQRAVEQSPDNPDIQFYNAVARDQFAERGGTQDDNLFATKIYRKLAADGHELAEYALATMFDEDVGVSESEALATLQHAAAGELDAAVQCDALRSLAFSDIDGDTDFDMAAAEDAAKENYVCAGIVANMFWRGQVGQYELTRPLDSYVRYAAVHGDALSMAVLGLFYADGTDSTTIPDPLKGQYTAEMDTERAGYWMLLSYWGTQSVMRQTDYDNYWSGQMFVDPVTAGAMQAGLEGLGLYSGAVDGVWGEGSAGALEAFLTSGQIDELFQGVREAEPMDDALGGMVPTHIDTQAIAQAAGL